MPKTEAITDAQVTELLELAQYHDWSHTVSRCYIALHGVIVKQTRRKIHRKREGAVYIQIREALTRIYNEERTQKLLSVDNVNSNP